VKLSYSQNKELFIMKRIFFVASAATSLALAAFGIASAHAELDHCTPAVTSTVASAPAQIVCVYSEEIDTKRSTMSVWDAAGNQVDKKDAHVDLNDPNHQTLVVSLDTSKTPNGLYTVQWRTVTPDDNGLSFGSWQFVIGRAGAAPYQPTQVLDGEVDAQGTPIATSAAPVTPAANATPSKLGIMIVSPADGASVPAGDVQVQVMPENVSLGPDYHWHLYVDGTMTDMVMNGGTRHTAHLTPGQHEIKVSLADKTHAELASAVIHITAEGNTSNAAVANPTPTAEASMPSTMPTTGAAANNGWLWLLVIGGALLIGGTLLTVKR
jgi:methionine-rich copper-binding protein CopC